MQVGQPQHPVLVMHRQANACQAAQYPRSRLRNTKHRPGRHLMAVVVFIAGPAATIDTACSSSLSSVALVATLMRAGGCGRAIAAAALLTLDPRTIRALAAAAMLAPDGRCKTLDAAADGYVYIRRVGTSFQVQVQSVPWICRQAHV
jgi:3-oxoacyl-(acyl-carrier-protein) synthase